MVGDQSQSNGVANTGRNTATPFLAFLFAFLILMAIGLHIGQVSMEVKPDTASMTNNEIVNGINVTESSLSLHYNDSTTPSRAYLLHNGTTIDRQILSVAENEVVFKLPREHYTSSNISVNYTVRFEGSDRVLDELNVKVYN